MIIRATIPTAAVMALMCGSAMATPTPTRLTDTATAQDGLVQLVRRGGSHGGSAGFRSGARFSGHHRSTRFVGAGFYGYSPYYASCWYSRRYHRWVCPYY